MSKSINIYYCVYVAILMLKWHFKGSTFKLKTSKVGPYVLYHNFSIMETFYLNNSKKFAFFWVRIFHMLWWHTKYNLILPKTDLFWPNKYIFGQDKSFFRKKKSTLGQKRSFLVCHHNSCWFYQKHALYAGLVICNLVYIR